MVLVLLGTFVLVNLFVSVVTGVLSLEEAAAAKDKAEVPQHAAIQWLVRQYRAIGERERGRDERWRVLRLCHRVVESVAFLAVVYSAIFLNLVALCIDHYPQSNALSDALAILNIVFNIVFTVEIVLKWIGLGFYAWSQVGFNWFDLVIVGASWIELIIGEALHACVRACVRCRLTCSPCRWPSVVHPRAALLPPVQAAGAVARVCQDPAHGGQGGGRLRLVHGAAVSVPVHIQRGGHASVRRLLLLRGRIPSLEL